jgi:hypothetical protein
LKQHGYRNAEKRRFQQGQPFIQRLAAIDLVYDNTKFKNPAGKFLDNSWRRFYYHVEGNGISMTAAATPAICERGPPDDRGHMEPQDRARPRRRGPG